MSKNQSINHISSNFESKRGELTDLREKRYESQNRGIYMFRLDDYRVVDATMTVSWLAGRGQVDQ